MDISRPSTAVTALACLALVCAYRFQEALTAAGIPISRMICNLFGGFTLQSLPFLAISSLIAAAIEVFLSPRQLARLFPRGRVAGCVVAFFYSALLPSAIVQPFLLYARCSAEAFPRALFHHSFCGAIHQPACPVFNVVCLWPVTESSVATIDRRHRLHHDNCSFTQHPHAVSDGGFASERVG